MKLENRFVTHQIVYRALTSSTLGIMHHSRDLRQPQRILFIDGEAVSDFRLKNVLSENPYNFLTSVLSAKQT